MKQYNLSRIDVRLLNTKKKDKKTTLINQGCFEYGAGNGAQTRDLRLGKATLYQLSYSRVDNMYNKLYRNKSQYQK